MERGSSSAPWAGHDDDDDEDDYEEHDGGNRLLGFMFGNVDGAGDLDVDYLDEDAKERLAALADKLGHSLRDIDLIKSSPGGTDVSEQDYDEKAEDAIDYEDFDEPYDGPEVQGSTEEDFLLPKKAYFSSDAELASLNTKTSVFGEENYDDDDDNEDIVKENMAEKNTLDAPSLPSEDEPFDFNYKQEISPNDDSSYTGTMRAEDTPFELEEFQEEPDNVQDHIDSRSESALPVLCVEDGLVILRFSEIFGVHEPFKKVERKSHRKLSTNKESVKMMNIADIIEEDEEEYLRSSSNNVLITKHHCSTPEDVEETCSDTDEPIRDSCLCSQPMKADLFLDMHADGRTLLCPDFYPFEQQDWEDEIIWGNSPKVSPSLESRALFEVDGDSHMKAESDEEFEQKNVESGENGFSFVGESIVVESLGSREPQVLTNLHSSERIYHPQLLRLEALPNMGDVCSVGMRTENGNADVCKGDWLRRFSKLTLQNNDLLEGSWVDQIIWDSDGAIPKPKLILDLQDEHMLFEILDHKDAEHIRSHAGAMVITCSPRQETFDSCGQMITSAGPFNISNDPYDLNRKSSQQAKSHAKKRASLRTKVMHSVPALKLQTMKPRLSNKDVANFHRPKALWYPHENLAAANLQGTLHTSGLMKIILMSIGGKAIKLNISADETLSSLKTKASKKLDFKSSEKVKIFYSGKELDDDKSLSTENVLPNSVLHLVRTRIHVWPRAQKLPGENKPLRPPGAFKKKSELSVKDGHVFLMEYCEERPLFLGNVGMGARLCTYYQKTAPGGQTASIPRNGNDGLGSVIALDPADKSPFLGDISLSSSQSCIETNMYRAPIFSHKCSLTDYLLVRSAKGMLSLRRIDKVYVVGQQEPHMEVLSPGTKYVQLYLADRLMAYLYREFRAKEKPNLLPSIRADELAAQFPSLTDAFIRKRVKQCAELRKGPKGHWVWVKRRDFRTPTEEELRRILTPESVCSYESMLAGLHRLKSLGISKLTHPVGLSSAMNQLPDEAITLAAASHIERELQITSWNLTSNFVACISQGRDNIERLEITGVGDPSGRGLGFSYVRATPKAPISSVAVKKKASAARGSSAVTGTDADLRRLSMDAAREVLLKFNVPEVQIDKLTRWHRIAMVRKLSSEQAASGVKVDAVTLNKFARGQRMSFLQLQQQSREKCQEIWDRQVQSLSAADGDENDSDCEANSDLDSFAGDLENLLDAEECEEDDGSTPLKADNVDGVRGIKMRRCPSHAQTEAEIEDDEAEAFLIRRLLEDNADDLKKKKPIFTDVNNGYQSGTEYIGSAKKPNSIIRPFSSMIHADGSFTSKDVIMQEPIEVEKSLAERNVTWKVSAKKGNGKEENTPVGMLKMKSGSLKDRPKFFKEKKPMDKPVREGFACGACGQSGHMRTNKNCPKYGEDMLSEKKHGEDAETTDLGSVSTKSHLPDVVGQAKLKTPNKKVTPKVLKVADLEVAESVEKTGSMPALQPVKFPSLKFKCGPSEKSLSGTQTPDKQNVPDGEMETQSKRKINRIVFSNMINSEDVPSDMHKPSVVVRLPIDTEKDQRRKKIIIKQPRSMGKLEQVKRPIDTAEDHGFRKIKKIVELSSFERQKKHEDVFHAEETNKRNSTFERSHRNEEKRKSRESIAEDRTMRIVERRPKEEHRSLRGIRMQGAIREEEPPKEKKKKKKKKKHDFSDEHLLDRRAYRNDRRISERDRAAKRRAINDLEQAENTHFTKRRRGGEVVLSNILEAIVDELMKTYADVSYLFHKPVNKKEAPDYYDVIKNPMDLSTIRDRVRNLVYKSREEFRHDIWQITYNAHAYNDGRNPGIPPLADQLLELCDYLIQDKGEMLTDAEADIKVQV